MQTFLPYPDFARSAAVLDAPRLGKQRVETLQVLRALELPDYGWVNHPAVRMWRGCTPALVAYGLACVAEWKRPGRADSTERLIAEFAPEVVGRAQAELAHLMPPWLGDEAVHRSHRSALLRKDPAFYRPVFGDGEPDDLPYHWPDPPSLDPPVRGSGRLVWVVRPGAPEAVGEFLTDGVVGLGTESGIDVDVRLAGEGATLRQLLKEVRPGRRPGKDLRVLDTFVNELEPGDEVALPIEGERALLLGEVVGEYEFDARKGVVAPHRRRVRWGGRVARSDVQPPALLQDPRKLFCVDVAA
ncbi:MSMEG_6728 family protein [Kineococcus sp. SYSU DK006]|uniref:MSMEG_6728 family protein n=1 Tax=Kineococcus sp. SYSU DK006 TaxID=3383127 RepID=UPI003D7D3493